MAWEQVIVFFDECTASFSYEAVRASMGAIFNIGITASNLENFLKWKSEKNISLIGTSLRNASDYTIAKQELPLY